MITANTKTFHPAVSIGQFQSTGEYSYAFDFRYNNGTRETKTQRRQRFDTELQVACKADAGFADYVKKNHRGNAVGINNIDTNFWHNRPH